MSAKEQHNGTDDLPDRPQLPDGGDALYTGLFSSHPAAMLLIEPDTGRIVDANPAACRYYGFTREELTSRRILDINTLDEEQVRAEMLKARKQQRSQFQFRHRLADGSVRDVEVFAGPVQVGERQLLYSVIHDVTERCRAEQALQDSEERFRRLFQLAPLGYQTLDEKGRLVSVNQAWLGIMGYTHDEVIGRPFIDFLTPSSESRFSELFKRIQQDGSAGDAEIEAVRKDGVTVVIELNGRVSTDAESGFGLAHWILHDITRRKEVEAERRMLETKLQQAQKLESLGVLAGGIAHDFNNILMGVLGTANLATMKLGSGAPVRHELEQIQKAAQRAAGLTRQMLAYAGKGKFAVEPVNLSELVRELVNLIKVSVSKSVKLDLDLATGIPSMEGDVNQLQQLVMNLVINASESIGDGEGTVRISTRSRECGQAYLSRNYLGDRLAEGSYVSLRVSDNGSGMDEETLERIFDPFFSTKFPGRGLGLAAVIGIVRGHSGGLRVQSEPGEGSTFEVLFPVSGKRLAETRAAPFSHRELRGSGAVLVVDDEEAVLESTLGILEWAGFTAITARDGVEAVEVFRQRASEIDVVLLDLTMPRMGGEETLRRIRDIRPDVRVVLSSGYEEEDATHRFTEEGLAGFIQKPYMAQDLVRKLKDILKG